MDMNIKPWHPDKTILVQIKNPDIKIQIIRWATELGFDVIEGDGLDLIAVGYLFAIVDKQEVGTTVWNSYLDYLRESEDSTPCVVINSICHELEADIPNLHFEPKTDLMDWTLLLNDLLQKLLHANSFDHAEFAIIPEDSYTGELPLISDAEIACAARLRSDVEMLAKTIGERHTKSAQSLRNAATYIVNCFKEIGFNPIEEKYQADGQQVANIVVELPGNYMRDEIVVIGAHYDSVFGTPGANDNASGVAVLLEIARRFCTCRPGRTLRLVAFVNEEPPFFWPLPQNLWVEGR